MPDGCKLVIYENGQPVATGDSKSVSYKIPGELSSAKTYTVKVIGEDKDVMKDGSGRELTATVSVTVKQGLWNNIIAFFRKLFRMNSVTI